MSNESAAEVPVLYRPAAEPNVPSAPSIPIPARLPVDYVSVQGEAYPPINRTTTTSATGARVIDARTQVRQRVLEIGSPSTVAVTRPVARAAVQPMHPALRTRSPGTASAQTQGITRRTTLPGNRTLLSPASPSASISAHRERATWRPSSQRNSARSARSVSFKLDQVGCIQCQYSRCSIESRLPASAVFAHALFSVAPLSARN